MTSDFPRDYLARAVLDGSPVDALEDDEADESADTAIGYGSLLSLGATIRKKQPLIVIDPVEAENEARRVQHIAAQQLAGHDEADALDFLTGLPELVEAAIAGADELQPGTSAADGRVAADEAVEEAAGDPPRIDPALDDEAGDVDALCLDEVPTGGELFPGAIEDPVEVVDDSGDSHPAATAPPPESLAGEPDAAPAVVGHQGHSLRARVPTQPSRRTFVDRLAAFGRWLHEWLTRDRA